MSQGLYNHTTRATGITLTAAIYNTDHVNHITNQNPSMTGAYSDSVIEMQAMTTPGGVGSESLAPHLAGELERIRFCIDRIVGGAQWYEAPATDLATIALGPLTPVTLADNETVLHMRRTENDAVEREVFDLQSGSGVGVKYSERIVGSGANAVAEVRRFIGAAEIQRWTALLARYLIDTQIGDNLLLAAAGYAELTEIAAPANPAANKLRRYAFDDSGVSRFAVRDSAGVVAVLYPTPARAIGEYTANSNITGVIPIDDSIPQNTEGSDLAAADTTITLVRPNSRVRITVTSFGRCVSAAGDDNRRWTLGLFVDSVADALRAVPGGINNDNSGVSIVSSVTLIHEYAPGSVGPFTYKLRAGVGALGEILRLNGEAARFYGGVASTIMIVEEIFVS